MDAPINRSMCKYAQPPEGPVRYCYVSDEHLMHEIEMYIYPEPIEWVYIVLYIIIFLFGVTGNALVCYAVWRNHQLRTTTNLFLVNLAVADFFVMTICLPPSFAQTILETWFLGNAMCKAIKYYQTVCVIVSILTLTAISIERCFAICYPLTFKETKTRVILALVIVWVTGLISAVPKTVFMSEVNDGLVPRNLTILLTSCKPTDNYGQMAFIYEIVLIVIFYVIPILVMGYTYTMIAICLWTSIREGQQLTGGAQSAVAAQVRARRRTAKMLIVVVVVFILCFLPVYTWNMVRILVRNLDAYMSNTSQSIMTLTSHWLVYLNSAINPVIYNFMSAKFRKEFQAACTCWFSICAKRRGTGYTNHELEPLSSRSHRYRVGEYDSSDVSRMKTTVTDA